MHPLLPVLTAGKTSKMIWHFSDAIVVTLFFSLVNAQGFWILDRPVMDKKSQGSGSMEEVERIMCCLGLFFLVG